MHHFLLWFFTFSFFFSTSDVRTLRTGCENFDSVQGCRRHKPQSAACVLCWATQQVPLCLSIWWRVGRERKKMNTIDLFFPHNRKQQKWRRWQGTRADKCTALGVRIAHPGTTNALSEVLGRFVRVNMPCYSVARVCESIWKKRRDWTLTLLLGTKAYVQCRFVSQGNSTNKMKWTTDPVSPPSSF